MVGYDSKKDGLSQKEYVFAGATAGVVTRFLCQPLDVLKIRFQLQVEPISRSSPISKYKGVVQAAGTILKEEGLVGLWRGHTPGQLLSIMYGVSQFWTFEKLTHLAEENLVSGRHIYVHFVCGSLAGAAATLSSFPFDVLRTRFVAQGGNKAYLNTVHGGVTLLRAEGVRGLFRGLSPTILQVAPHTGAQFAFHNFFSKALTDFKILTRDRELHVHGNLLVGFLAGLFSKLIVYPFDLMRKRLQFQGFQNARKGYGQNFSCSGLISCLRETVRKEGVRALFKGLYPALVKASITTSLHFTVYEETCRLLALIKKPPLK